jgi:signal transduction histidine kinase
MDQSIIQTIFDTHRLAYVLTDRNLTIVDVGGLTAIIGGDPPAAGTSLIARVPELSDSASQIDELLAGGAPSITIEHINRPNPRGPTDYISLTVLPYQGQPATAELLILIADTSEQGRVLQLLAQGRNEQRLLSEQLARQNQALATANAELRRLDEMKSNFVAVAAHELRNPLTPILGYIELLLDEECGPLTSDQRETLHIMLKNVLRLRTITSDLLDLARIEAGRIELLLQPVDLRTLVEMICSEYQPQLTAKKQALHLHVAGALPNSLCDETRAAQIVGNLISNASKYTPANGQIAVTLSAAADGFLQIAVADTGIGIASEDQEFVFNAFYRARAAARQNTSGTGLGLHITRLLVELHGGQIWFTSSPGRSTIFYVTFPIADEEEPTANLQLIEASS